MKQSTSPLSEQSISPQQVSRIVTFMLAVTSGGIALGALLLTITNEWELTRQQGTFASWSLYLVFPVLAFFLSRRGRPLAAIWVVLGGLWFVLALVESKISGYGIVAGSLGVLLTAFAVLQARIQSRAAVSLIVGSIGAGLFLLLFDLFGSAARPEEEALFLNLIGGLMAVLTLLFAVSARHRWLELSLASKLVIGFIALSAVSVAAMTVITVQSMTGDLTDEAGATLKTVAENKAQTIGSLLDREETLLLTLASSQNVQAVLERANARYESLGATAIALETAQAEQQWHSAQPGDPIIQSRMSNGAAAEFNAFRSSQADNLQVLVTDRYGSLAATTHRTDLLNQSDQEWWQKAFNGGQGAVYISEPTFFSRLYDWGVIVAAPVRLQASGELAGVIQTVYRVTAFAPALTTAQLGKTGTADLAFPSLQVLRSKGDIYPLEAAAAAHLRDQMAGYMRMPYEGRDALVSRALVARSVGDSAGAGWMVIVRQDPTEALQPVNAATRTAVLASAGVLILALLTALFIAQFLTGPIVHLTAAAARVAEGDLSVRAPVETGDETGRLALTFNRMTDQLRLTLGTLEQRVAERTADLAAATEQLRTHARELETGAEVSRAISSTLNLQELLAGVTRLLGERFSLDHAAIYLLSETGESAAAAAVYRAREGVAKDWRPVACDDSSPLGRAIMHGEPQFPGNADSLNPASPAGTSRGELILPLHLAGRVIGAVAVERARPPRLTENEVNHLIALSSQVAIGIQNARSYERQAALAEENRRLLEQAREAVADLDALNRRLTREGWQEYMLNQQGDLIVQDADSRAGAKDGQLPLMAESMDMGELLIAQEQDESAMAVPIVVRGEIIGSLGLEGDPHYRWTSDQVAILKDIAEHLALSVENARLIEETQTALSESRRLAEREARRAAISDQLHRTTDIQGILRIAAEELRRSTGSSRAVVRLSRSSDYRGRPEDSAW